MSRSEPRITNDRTLLAKSIACSFMALTATKEQLLFGKGGLSQPIVARRGSPGDFANSVRSFLLHCIGDRHHDDKLSVTHNGICPSLRRNGRLRPGPARAAP